MLTQDDVDVRFEEIARAEGSVTRRVRAYLIGRATGVALAIVASSAILSGLAAITVTAWRFILGV